MLMLMDVVIMLCIDIRNQDGKSSISNIIIPCRCLN